MYQPLNMLVLTTKRTGSSIGLPLKDNTVIRCIKSTLSYALGRTQNTDVGIRKNHLFETSE